MSIGSEVSMDETMSILSARSRTPSPLESRPELSSSEMSDGDINSSGRRHQRPPGRSPGSRIKQQFLRPGDEMARGFGKHTSSQRQGGYLSTRGTLDVETRDAPNSPSMGQASLNRPRRVQATDSRSRVPDSNTWRDDRSLNARTEAGSSNQGRYAETLLNYFVSDSTSLPSILVDPPQDLDFDLIIDEEGHTPLHWAVAMARTKVVRLLVQHGADIYRVNNQGQTALMRSVLFTNNFDMKTFATLLEVLQKTIFTIDKNDQTVFHHVAVTAGMRGKVHASRYYMECLLDKLTPHPQELASIINVQDTQGDTALTIAARAGNKKVVKLLLDARADPKIRNRAGLNADEILRDADMQISPAPSLVSSLLATATSSAAASSSLLPTQRPQNYSQQQPLPPQQQRHPTHQPPHHPAGGNSGGYGSVNQQRVNHTVSQQPHYPPGSMPPSASSSTAPRMHQPTPSPHGHPSSSMRLTPPPPASRQGGHPTSSSNMDRPTNTGYQDYPPRNQLASHPHHGQHLDARSGPTSGRGPSGYSGHYPGQGDEHGVSLERSSSSRGQAGVRGQGRPLQRMIPQVTELFEQLTEAYEKDLYEKEQDLLNARNMLQETQTEIQEGRKTVEELRSKTVYLGQAEEQIKTLESMIRQEINLRQRLRLESLVTQEEARLKLETEATTTTATSITGGTGNFVERADALEREAVELRSKLADLQKSRQEQVEQIVQLKSQQGKRRHEYKRLIALCCNVSIDEVDGLLGPLLNTLGNADGVN